MDAVMMMAAACAAKCPPHAIAAVAGAFVVGILVGRLTKKCKGACAGKKGGNVACTHARPSAGVREQRTGSAHQPIPAGSVEIYVGNMSYDMTEEEIRKQFAEFGTISAVRLVTNRFNNRSKGFGFVVMPNRDEAEKAIAALNDREYLGRKLRVNEAKNTIQE